ncbi:MAG: diguanylate cyclase [Aminipila sp.]
MESRKVLLENELESYRFSTIPKKIFDLYNEYESLCRTTNDLQGLLYLEFYRGETNLRLGNYEEAQDIINKCLLNPPAPVTPALRAKCHNILGLIYTAMGYQMVALENFLTGLDFAIQAEDSRQKNVIHVNMGCLYRDLGDYDKALFYYYQALREFTYRESNSFYSLKILCYSYICQIYFKTARYKEGLEILSVIDHLISINPGEFYYISISNIRVRAFHYLMKDDEITKILEEVIKQAHDTEDFLEFSADYLDLCNFIIDFNPKYSRMLIDVLRNNINKISLPFLLLNLQKLEVIYKQNYASKEEFLASCGEYVTAQQHYDIINRSSKLKGLNNIEVLRKVQKQCEIYLEQSKLDLMTGLLNKSSFEDTVSTILQKKSSNSSCLFAFAIIDLDHFKKINDTYGHIEGDKALLEIVHFMTDAFDGSAILGRIGGDEFGVFWPFVESISDIYFQISEMQKSFNKHCKKSDDINCDASVSIGIMYSKNKPFSYKELFQRADDQLYKAKAAGRGTISIENN